MLYDLSLVTVGLWLLTLLYQLDKQMMNELLFFLSMVSLSCLVTEPILYHVYKITAGTKSETSNRIGHRAYRQTTFDRKTFVTKSMTVSS